MFKRIKNFFLESRREVLRVKELCAFSRKDIAIIRQELEELKIYNQINMSKLLVSQAEINKKFSSIEMELLMARGACLDNNFPGKEDL